MAGFTAYLNRTKTQDGESRRDTELLRPGINDTTPKAGSNQITLNIKAVIGTKHGGTNQEGVVNEVSSTLEVPEPPKLLKT